MRYTPFRMEKSIYPMWPFGGVLKWVHPQIIHVMTMTEYWNNHETMVTWGFTIWRTLHIFPYSIYIYIRSFVGCLNSSTAKPQAAILSLKLLDSVLFGWRANNAMGCHGKGCNKWECKMTSGNMNMYKYMVIPMTYVYIYTVRNEYTWNLSYQIKRGYHLMDAQEHLTKASI